MKPIVTDTYDFPTLIEYGYVYVDKTALLRRMVSGVDGRFFFMSRPRRFGKSLMISTLEQIFGGNRKLFKGLDIAKSDYAWEERPVLRLDMSRYDNTRGVGDFQRQFSAHMGSRGSAARALEDRIAALATTSRDGKIVVLVDEYDSPISGLLDRPDELEEMRSCLQTIYRVLKSNAHRLHFLMMTGVSKFTKLALRQITAKRYADAFASDTRRIVTVGVNYNPKNGQVEIECGEVNGEVNSGSGEVNGKVNSTRGEVNAYVAAHPGCRRKAMAEALSIAARTLDRNLAALIAEGRLEFRGAPKNGGYYVKEAARDA